MGDLVAFRVASWDTPLRVNAHRTEARYNRVGSPPTQYLSLHPLTPWAEYCRNHGLRGADDVAAHRLRTWAVKVQSDSLVAIGYDDAADWGLAPEDLVADEHSPCQQFAERVRGDAHSPNAIIVPSAALPGTRNLVIFGERVATPYDWTPLDEVDLPASIVAEAARPPSELFPLIRYHGDAHAEFEAWRSGVDYQFADLNNQGRAR